jgi:hypothetical protein
VAVPEAVAVNVPFDLAVAVLRAMSPPLQEEGLDRVKSRAARVEWSPTRPWIDLRAHVFAPDCRIAGQPFQLFRLHRDQGSVPVYFSLTPLRTGDLPIRVTLFQAFIQVGNARLTARASERVAGSVETHVSSGVKIPHIHFDEASGVYSLLNGAFSMDELAVLCQNLDIDLDELPGTTKQRKASELVAHCRRHRRVEDLIAHIIAARPNWIDLVEGG